MKVVLVESFMCSFTVFEVSRIFYILPKRRSRTWSISYFEPNMLPTLSRRLLNFYLKVSTWLRPFSRMFGKFRKRRVWPVGAVSKTITSKSIFSIELSRGGGT
jgi:hypothetical protein